MSVNGSDILSALNAGSGINAKNLVDQLVAAERAPRESMINEKIESATADISGYGQLSASLSALRSATGDLKDQRDFAGTLVTTESNAVSYQVTDVTQVGTYAIEVNSLAQRRQVVFGGYAAATTTIGSGSAITVSITVGGTTQAIEVDDPTPQAVVDAVNAAGGSVTARLVDDGSGSNAFKVILSGGSARTTTLRFHRLMGRLVLAASSPRPPMPVSRSMASPLPGQTIRWTMYCPA